MKDRFGREIKTLRLSITDKCNFSCIYCGRNYLKLKKEKILSYEEIIKIVKIFSNTGIENIKITGGEPLIRKEIEFLLSEISKISGIKEISLTTNGFFLYEKIYQIKDFLKRINISLDTLNREKFKYITGLDGLDNVLKGIEKAVEFFSPVKLNVVVMRGINTDEITNFINFCEKYGLILRFIEFMPTINTIGKWRKWFISYKEVIEIIEKSKKIYFLEDSHNTIYYTDEDKKIKIGFITSVSRPFCENCNKIRVDCKGDLFLCLYGGKVVNFKDLLNNFPENEIEGILMEIISQKKYSENPSKSEIFSLPCMTEIGG